MIRKRIHLDTTIISDGWNASNDLNKIGYNHEVIILKENVDLQIPYAHTKNTNNS